MAIDQLPYDQQMKILFLYLSAFGITGGIEKFNKAFMKALSDIAAEEDLECSVLSVYDSEPDKKYFSRGSFKGFNGKRTSFILSAVRKGIKSDKVFIGHINLAFAGILIKLFKPGLKVYLVAHGVEIWDKINFIKKYFLNKCDYILAVSSYTKERIIKAHNFPADRIIIFPNTLDPYFKIPEKFEKPAYILNRLKISENDKVLLTLGRISSVEGKKGYNKVIASLPEIKKVSNDVKYLIAGSYDKKEYDRINQLVKEKELTDTVTVTGFINEEELSDYYCCCDIFIMPSKQEGFGIVFLEAMVCGLPVIAGNKDGSRDAIAEGTNYNIIDPDNEAEIKNAILDLLNRKMDKGKQKELTLKKFGFQRFKNNLKAVLEM